MKEPWPENEFFNNKTLALIKIHYLYANSFAAFKSIIVPIKAK